jgi:type IV pilus assembly protein PilY1
VLYAPTNDGQLHAFKVAPSPKDTTDTFKVDTWPAQNELWSFFPPAVLHRIPSQYPSTHQSLLDGPPMVADVVFARDAGSAESGGAAADWHTVLVAGFGAAGSGYYALDITNPTAGPKMLWQLTTDAAQNRLFGERSGVPTIATLYFDPTVGGTNPKQYAVAILPGGQSAGPTGVACNQNPAVTTLLPSLGDYPMRTQVQCWAKDAARSVTIVMLETGRIVRTFRDKDTPASINGLAQDAALSYAALYAPMTGPAVVFPAGEGTVSDRAFLGDGDGMFWRMNLTSTNPRDWKIDLWFDAYAKEATPPPPWKAGEPIMTAPVLSVDRLGAVTVAFSTGDQETFTPGAIKNYLWSLRENPDTFHSEVLWYQEFTNGTRVSGPMVLYGSILYFTTLTPVASSDSNRCSSGASQLCGENYFLQQTAGTAAAGGAWALPDPSDPTQKTLTQCIPLSGIAFGPTIGQQPTCSQTDQFSDPYLGWGTHTRMVGGVTGGKSSLTVTVTNTTQGAVPVQYDLPPPTNTTRIDSWASVIE